MDNKMTRDKAMRLASESLKKVKWSRYYACDGAILLGLGALISEWAASRSGEPFTQADVIKFLEQLRPFTPALFQNRPGPEQPAIDLESWKDPATGKVPPNPFDKNTLNISEQAWLEQNQPQLAKYLKEVAEAGGLSYRYLAGQRDEKANREALRDLVYTVEEHETNVFRGKNLSLQNSFRQSLGNDVANFFQREAQTPAELPWLGEKPNLTLTSKLAKDDPALHQLVKASITTARQWANDVFAEAKVQQTSVEGILGVPIRP